MMSALPQSSTKKKNDGRIGTGCRKDGDGGGTDWGGGVRTQHGIDHGEIFPLNAGVMRFSAHDRFTALKRFPSLSSSNHAKILFLLICHPI
jgi:hypothetical protein